MSNNSNKPGFIADGSGTDGAYGRDPETNLAYKRNGDVRKARTTRTVAEKMAKFNADMVKHYSTMGAQVLAALAGFAAFNGTVGKFKAWVREARAVATPEARQTRIDSLQRQIDTIEAKGECAVAFLATADAADSAVAGIYSQVGKSYMDFQTANGRAPNEDEGAEIIAGIVDADAIAVVESAGSPENDPFKAFRRDAGEATGDESEDVLD